jgi:FixJ family two-component response regulator
MTADNPTVFVVDDDDSVLRSIARVLRLASYAVETFSSPPEFLKRPRFEGTGCLILDLQMPEMSGLELQRQAQEGGSTLPVIFLSGQGDIPAAVQAVKAGAMEFLEKPFASEKLLQVVESAMTWHRQLLSESRTKAQAQARFDRLTPREREVCVRVGRGLLNKQIAFELGSSEKTIKLHRARVMRKLDVSSVAELVDLLRSIGAK